MFADTPDYLEETMGSGQYGTPMTTFRIPRQFRRPVIKRETSPIPCPVCLVGPGKACRAVSGNRGGPPLIGLPVGKIHRERHSV